MFFDALTKAIFAIVLFAFVVLDFSFFTTKPRYIGWVESYMFCVD